MFFRGLLSPQSVEMHEEWSGAVCPGVMISHETLGLPAQFAWACLGANSHEMLGWPEQFAWACDVLLIPLNRRDHYCVFVRGICSSLYVLLMSSLIGVFPVRNDAADIYPFCDAGA